MAPSKELVTIETPNDAIEALRGNLTIRIEDPAEVQRQMMERILESDNVDDILGRNIAIHAQDVVDRGFTLTAVRYMKSKYKDGLPVFAVMDAAFLDDGSTGSITCSANNVATQAAMLWKLDALPCNVVIRRADEPTTNGYYPLWLEKA